MENVQISSKHLVLCVSQWWCDAGPGSPFYVSRSFCDSVTLHWVGFITGDHSLSNPVRIKWFVANVEIRACLGLKVFPVVREAKSWWSVRWLKSKEIQIKCSKNVRLLANLFKTSDTAYVCEAVSSYRRSLIQSNGEIYTACISVCYLKILHLKLRESIFVY